MAKIVKEIGVVKYRKHVKDGYVNDKGEVEYPGDRFDVIWTIETPYDAISKVSSEAGLDHGMADR